VSAFYHWLWMVHWGRVGTWALAIGTFLLAFFTWRVSRAAIKTLDQNKSLVDETHRLVESNNLLIKIEERHHQENLRPICVFEFGEGVSSEGFSIKGFIVNKGRGASIEGVLYIILPSSLSYISIPFPTLGNGDRWVEEECYDLQTKLYKKQYFIPLINCDVTSAGAVQKAFDDREIVFLLEYKDLFGSKLLTEQKMNKDNGQFSIMLTKEDKVPIDGLTCLNPSKGV
jgi:hypothetical protein